MPDPTQLHDDLREIVLDILRGHHVPGWDSDDGIEEPTAAELATLADVISPHAKDQRRPRMTDHAPSFDLLVTSTTGRSLMYRYDPGQPWQVIARFDSYNDAEMVLRLLDQVNHDNHLLQVAGRLAGVAARVDGQAIAARREGTKFPAYLNESLLDLNLVLGDYQRALVGGYTHTTKAVGPEAEPQQCAHGKTVDEVCTSCIADEIEIKDVNPVSESPDRVSTGDNVDTGDDDGHC